MCTTRLELFSSVILHTHEHLSGVWKKAALSFSPWLCFLSTITTCVTCLLTLTYENKGCPARKSWHLIPSSLFSSWLVFLLYYYFLILHRLNFVPRFFFLLPQSLSCGWSNISDVPFSPLLDNAHHKGICSSRLDLIWSTGSQLSNACERLTISHVVTRDCTRCLVSA